MDGRGDDWQAPREPLGRYLLNRLQTLDDRVIQVYPQFGESVTAREMATRTLRYAAALQALGVSPGTRVVICCGCHPHYPALLLAILCCGATCSTINPHFDSGDLGRLLALIRPRLVFSVPDALCHLGSIVAAPALITLGEGVEWQRFLEGADGRVFLEPDLPELESAIAFIWCSSGTTGMPKGVMLSQSNLFYCLQMFRRPDVFVRADDTLVITSPMYWITGPLYSMSCMERGSRLVLEYGASEERLLKSIGQHKATVLFTSNNFLTGLAKHPAVDRLPRPTLRLAMCGGAAMAEEAQRTVESLLGVPVIQLYGMTEMMFGCGVHGTTLHKAGSVGLVLPYMSVKTVDPDSGRTVARGDVGELMFKGPNLSPGYLDNPVATAATFTADGWVHSGDLGYVDEDGHVFVTGRIKDIIKFRGDHVSPAELEAILVSHPDVAEAVVVGVPHPVDQMHPRAYVVRRSAAQVSAEELQELVAGRVAQHKRLRGGVRFVDSLPKSLTGKILRMEVLRL